MNVAAYDVLRVNAPYQFRLMASLSQVLESGQLILGNRVRSFEQDFAQLCGVSDCIGVGNGLDALVLALRASGVGPQDEVIVPAFTFAATWFAASQLGARPIPVDVRLDGLIDPDLIEAAITPRTRAIVPVHLFGALADMDAILAIAERHGIAVIEDAAQAHGAERAGRRAGSFGVAAAFSFYPTKNLGALGDGGAVCTNDRILADRLRKLRNYGSTKKYVHEVAGQNTRLDELQAAFLAVKLPNLAASNARRQHIAEAYIGAMRSAAGHAMALPEFGDGSVWHQFVVRSPYRGRLQSPARWSRDVGNAHSLSRGAASINHVSRETTDRDKFPVAVRISPKRYSAYPMADYLTDAEIAHVDAGCALRASRGASPMTESQHRPSFEPDLFNTVEYGRLHAQPV